MPVPDRATGMMRRAPGAFAFIVLTVVLAKASQWAAVDRFAPAIGFDAASLIGAAPVVIGAALLRRRQRRLPLA